MDSLPQTIVNKIVDIVTYEYNRNERLSLVTVSKKFQHAIEQKTFKWLHLNLVRVRHASGILSRSDRWSHVREVIFEIILPNYSEEACTRYENDAEKAENSRVFTQNIIEMFNLLSQCPVACATKPLTLQLSIFSETDTIRLGHTRSRGRVTQKATFTGPVPGDIRGWRYRRSKLQLDQSVRLAPIKHLRISSFLLRKCIGLSKHHRHVDAESVMRITSAIMQPHLKSFDCIFGDTEKIDLSRRIAHREDIAKVIDSLPRLDYFELLYEYLPPLNHDFKPPVLHNPDTQSDSVSCAIRKLTQRTKEINIYGILGSTELFWPKDYQPGAPKPYWQSLEYLKISYHPITPCGKWLFERDHSWRARVMNKQLFVRPEPREGRANEDYHAYQWRHTAIQKDMDEFYIAVGLAMANMPKLSTLELNAINLPAWRWDEKPLHAFSFKVCSNTEAVATWHSSPIFQPGPEVLHVWNQSAFKRGLELTIQILGRPILDGGFDKYVRDEHDDFSQSAYETSEEED
ncbi:hypothetical protein F5Y06DRAFT_298355 [Hypoxylon sp. FL0890]|nr:hypothetical protein F5Y06DRAFT_298355 [Hypoxylon sp. FL0890]